MAIFLGLLVAIFSAIHPQEAYADPGSNRAPPSCYFLATIYKAEKPIQEQKQEDVEIRIPTKRIELAEDREECRRGKLVSHKIEDTPFFLNMSYSAPCWPHGLGFEGNINDGGSNIFYYSKSVPHGENPQNVFTTAYFSSNGKSYYLSLTCL